MSVLWQLRFEQRRVVVVDSTINPFGLFLFFVFVSSLRREPQNLHVVWLKTPKSKRVGETFAGLPKVSFPSKGKKCEVDDSTSERFALLFASSVVTTHMNPLLRKNEWFLN